jgi:hypothetical protein
VGHDTGEACANDVRLHGTLGIGTQTDWACVLSISAGSTLLWGVMAVMLRRGAPLTPGVTSLLAGVAALSVGNLEACLTRPHPFAITVVLWHGLTSIVVAGAFALAAVGVFRWPAPRAT